MSNEYKLLGTYIPLYDKRFGEDIIGFSYKCFKCGYINKFHDNDMCCYGCGEGEEIHIDPRKWYNEQIKGGYHGITEQ